MKKNIHGNSRVKKTIHLTCMVFACILLAIPRPAMAVEPLKGTNDFKSKVLTTELKPAIYLTDGKFAMYGDSAPQVLFVDADDISSLYGGRAEFSSVEMIQVRLKSAADERVTIDRARLAAFPSLEYILFVYEYPACGDSGGEDCLESKASAAVTNTPAYEEGEDPVRVFYELCIPQ